MIEIVTGVDTLRFKFNTNCLYAYEKLTITYQAHKNFNNAYMIMLLFTSYEYSCGNWYNKMNITIALLLHYMVPTYLYESDKTDYNNWGTSLLSTTYTVLPNILLSRLTPYAEKVTGEHHCVFRRKRSTTDHIFCILQIPKKNVNKMKQLINYLQTSRKLRCYVSDEREVLYNILI
jgi:hypothetical protein